MIKNLKIYIVNAAECFTLIVLYNSVRNLLSGYSMCKYDSLLKIFGMIVISEIVAFTLSYISFRSRVTYLLTQFFSLYICLMSYAYLAHWLYNLEYFIETTILFVLFFIIFNFHVINMLKAEANEINQYLKKRNQL